MFSYFYFWTIMNSAAINIHVHYFGEHECTFLMGKYLGIELLGDQCFSGYCHTLFQSGCFHFPYCQQCKRVPIASQPCKDIYCPFKYSLSGRCIVASHYGYNLHFPDD